MSRRGGIQTRGPLSGEVRHIGGPVCTDSQLIGDRLALAIGAGCDDNGHASESPFRIYTYNGQRESATFNLASRLVVLKLNDIAARRFRYENVFARPTWRTNMGSAVLRWRGNHSCWMARQSRAGTATLYPQAEAHACVGHGVAIASEGAASSATLAEPARQI